MMVVDSIALEYVEPRHNLFIFAEVLVPADVELGFLLRKTSASDSGNAWR